MPILLLCLPYAVAFPSCSRYFDLACILEKALALYIVLYDLELACEYLGLQLAIFVRSIVSCNS